MYGRLPAAFSGGRGPLFPHFFVPASCRCIGYGSAVCRVWLCRLQGMAAPFAGNGGAVCRLWRGRCGDLFAPALSNTWYRVCCAKKNAWCRCSSKIRGAAAALQKNGVFLPLAFNTYNLKPGACGRQNKEAAGGPLPCGFRQLLLGKEPSSGSVCLLFVLHVHHDGIVVGG